MTRMNDAIVADHRPDDAEVEHLVRFCLGGIKSRADAAEPRTAQRRSHRSGT
jgi:hypothetical protein